MRDNSTFIFFIQPKTKFEVSIEKTCVKWNAFPLRKDTRLFSFWNFENFQPHNSLWNIYIVSGFETKQSTIKSKFFL